MEQLEIPKPHIINMFWPELYDQMVDVQRLIEELNKSVQRKESSEAGGDMGFGGGGDMGGFDMGGGGGDTVSNDDLAGLVGGGGGGEEAPPA